MVNNPPPIAGDTASIPGWETQDPPCHRASKLGCNSRLHTAAPNLRALEPRSTTRSLHATTKTWCPPPPTAHTSSLKRRYRAWAQLSRDKNSPTRTHSLVKRLLGTRHCAGGFSDIFVQTLTCPFRKTNKPFP